MKRILSILVSAAVIFSLAAMCGVSVSAFDIESDLIGYYRFNGSLKNEFGGEAEFMGKNFSVPFDDEPEFSLGYNDTSLYVGNSIGDGAKLDCVPTEDSYTISFWAKAESCGFAAPVIWIGSESHTDASFSSWVGLWADFDGSTWGSAPTLGSNDENNSKVGAIPKDGLSSSDSFGWTYITLVVDDGYGVLYFNGTEVANTVDNFARSLIPAYASGSATELPSMFGDDAYDDTAIYVAINVWDSPASMYYDELRVYDRALTSEDVAALYAVYDGHTPSDEIPENAETVLPVPDDEADDVETDAIDIGTTVDTEADSGDETESPDRNEDGGSDGGSDGMIWIIFGVIWAVLVVAIVIVIIKRRK